MSTSALVLQRALIAVAVIFPWINPFGLPPSPMISLWVIFLVFTAVFLVIVVFNIEQLRTRVLVKEDNFGGVLSVQFMVRLWFFAALINALIGSVQWAGYELLFAPFFNYSADGIAIGNMRQRNILATLLVIGLASSIYMAKRIRTQHAREIPKTGKYFLRASVYLLMFCLVQSQSRTGLLELVALLMLGWCIRKHMYSFQKHLLVEACIAYLVFIFLTPYMVLWIKGVDVTTYLSRWTDTTGSGRLLMYSNILDLIAQRPWTGYGVNGIAAAHYAYESTGADLRDASKHFPGQVTHAHNILLHIAATMGLPAALAFTATTWGFISWLKPWRGVNDQKLFAWAVLGVIFIHSFLEYPLWQSPLLLIFSICLIWILPDRHVHKAVELLIKHKTKARMLVVMLLLLCFAVAYDYTRTISWGYQKMQAKSLLTENPVIAASKSVFFKHQANMLLLQTAQLDELTAMNIYTLSEEILKTDINERIIELHIESATLIGKLKDAEKHWVWYQRAFPAAASDWRRAKCSVNTLSDLTQFVKCSKS